MNKPTKKRCKPIPPRSARIPTFSNNYSIQKAIPNSGAAFFSYIHPVTPNRTAQLDPSYMQRLTNSQKRDQNLSINHR